MGYYRILSEESFAQGVKLIQSLFAVFGVLPGPIELSSKDNLVRNSSEFFLRSQENLKRAVADSNATLSGPDRIGFADPGFREENALFATDPWLFGFTPCGYFQSLLQLPLDMFPSDPIRDCRVQPCWEQAQSDPSFDLTLCVWSSVAHPNERGEKAYFEAVLEQWRSLSALTDQPNQN